MRTPSPMQLWVFQKILWWGKQIEPQTGRSLKCLCALVPLFTKFFSLISGFRQFLAPVSDPPPSEFA